jgi:hypothetical protein
MFGANGRPSKKLGRFPSRCQQIGQRSPASNGVEKGITYRKIA